MRLTWKLGLVGLTTTAALATLFTLLAIYDSDRMPFGLRFVFWFSTIGAGLAAAALVAPWVFNGGLRTRTVSAQLIVLAALASVPAPFILLGFNTGYESNWPISNWIQQYFMSLIVATIIVFAGYAALKASGVLSHAASANEGSDASSVQKFLKRLPPKFQAAELYAISSEDHYIRVHTDIGNALILMRLSDALEELIAVDGIQTHRSWWVANRGVAEIVRSNGKQSVLLRSGVSAPIARTRIKLVREALL